MLILKVKFIYRTIKLIKPIFSQYRTIEVLLTMWYEHGIELTLLQAPCVSELNNKFAPLSVDHTVTMKHSFKITLISHIVLRSGSLYEVVVEKIFVWRTIRIFPSVSVTESIYHFLSPSRTVHPLLLALFLEGAHFSYITCSMLILAVYFKNIYTVRSFFFVYIKFFPITHEL